MFTSLLVRPLAHGDEWYWSWVARAVHANGMQAIHPSTLLTCANLLHSAPRPAKAIGRLPKGLKICPECIECAAYVRGYWGRPEVEVCPSHGCVLQSTCNSCGAAFGLKEILNACCECGQAIARSDATPASRRELALSEVFKWEDALPEQMALHEFAWTMLFRVARARRGRDLRFKDRRIGDHIADWLHLHGLSFDLSLEGVASFLSDLPSPLHQVTITTWLQQLTADRQCGQQQFEGLPLEQWLDVLRLRGAPMQRDRLIGARFRTVNMPGFYPLSVAARNLNIHQGRVRRWVKAGQLAAVSVPGLNHPFLMVSIEDVQACERLYSQTPGSAHKLRDRSLVCIGRGAKRLLRICGLLDCTGSPRPVSEMPLYALLETLKRLAIPREAATVPLIRLSDPQAWSWIAASALGQWLKEAGAGRQAIFRDPEVTGFEGLYISAEQLFNLRRFSGRHKHSSRSESQVDLFHGLGTSLQIGAV